MNIYYTEHLVGDSKMKYWQNPSPGVALIFLALPRCIINNSPSDLESFYL